MKHKQVLDETDLSILDALSEDGRIPFAELGRKIGLSQPAMSERVKRLEDREIVTGYSANINLAALDYQLTAIIRLATEHSNIPRCLKKFRDIPNIVQVSRITGNDCFSIRVVTRTAKELEIVVDAIAAFGAVHTSIVMNEENYNRSATDFVRIDTAR